MAATGEAISALIRGLKKTGQVCPKSYAVLSSSTWNENDFSNVLFALTRYPSQNLNYLFVSKIEQQPEITNYSSFPQILRYIVNQNYKLSHGLIVRWGAALAETGNFRLMNSLMMKINLPPGVLGDLDRKLTEVDVKETTTVLSNLINNLTRSKHTFSPTSYESILRSASSLWFPSRELSFLLYSLPQSTLPVPSMSKYLEHFSGQVESKALIMSPQDRARLLFAYTAVWTKVSERIVALVIREADYESLLDEDIGVILRSLSQHPTFDDDFLSSQLEPRISSSLDLRRFNISSLVIAFTNRQFASPSLYLALKKASLDTNQNSANCFVLMKHPCCTKEDRELYEAEIKKATLREGNTERTKARLVSLGEENTAREFESFVQGLPA